MTDPKREFGADVVDRSRCASVKETPAEDRRAVPDAEDIHVEQSLHVFVLGFDNGGADATVPGVVDDDVDRAEFLPCEIGERLDLIALGDVALKGANFHTGGGEL